MKQQIVDFFVNNGPSILVGSFISAVVSIVLAKWQMKKTPIIHCYKPLGSNKKLGIVCPPDIYMSIRDILNDNNNKLLKGWIINDGMDVVIFPNNNNLDLLLPEGCEVLGIITVSSEDLNITSNYEKNSFRFLLPPSFLSNERFYYYVFYKGQDKEDFEIKAKTRIGNVTIEDFQNTKSIIPRKLIVFMERAGYFVGLLAGIVTLFSFFGFTYVPTRNKEIEIYVEIIISFLLTIPITLLIAALILTAIYEYKFKRKIKKEYDKNMKNIKLWKNN